MSARASVDRVLLAGQAAGHLEAPAPECLRILLVEDDPIEAALVELHLETYLSTDYARGVAVQHVQTVESALSALSTGGFDVIISDMELPDSRGLATINALVSEAGCAPVIVLTGSEDERLCLQALRSGAQDYLVKCDMGPRLLRRVVHHSLERRRTELALARAVLADPLTGLDNRMGFNRALERSVAAAMRYKTRFSLLFVDLDGFKAINDTLGHSAGDKVIVEFSDRLRRVVRAEDVVSRLGGDEFAVIEGHIRGPGDATRLAQRLLSALKEPLKIRGRSVAISASIGLAVYPRDGRTPETLVRAADSAMYAAKRQGGNRHRFYDPTLDVQDLGARTREMALRRAMERDEFELHYQPQIAVKTGKVAGYEALIRWRRAGIVHTAGSFIEDLEELGLMHEIGAWTINAACERLSRLLSVGDDRPFVAVNISAHQLEDDRIVDVVRDALNKSGVPADLLELELTETALLHDENTAAAVLSDLKTLGVRIALDDFGTGYCSLSHLWRFPVDTIKIDRSLVFGMAEDSRKAHISSAICGLGRSLGLSVVAEGVETAAEGDLLAEMGCPIVQGYFYGRPAPLEDP